MKLKVEVLENHIKQMNKTDAGRSVCFSDLFIFSDLEYPQKFRVPKLEKCNCAGCPWTYLHLYRIVTSQYAKNEKLLTRPF